MRALEIFCEDLYHPQRPFVALSVLANNSLRPNCPAAASKRSLADLDSARQRTRVARASSRPFCVLKTSKMLAAPFL